MPESKEPKSPDELRPAIHGEVSGVSRIGRRAIAVVALVGLAIAGLILYGVQHSGSKTVAVETLPTAAAPAAIATDHFGASEPLALPTSRPTLAPPIQLGTPAPPPATEAARQPVPVQELATAAPAPVPEVQATAVEVRATAVAQSEAAAAETRRAGAQAAREVDEERRRERGRQVVEQQAEQRAQALASAQRAPAMISIGAGNVSAGAAGAAAASTSAAPVSSSAPTGFLNGPTGQLAGGAAQRPLFTDRIPPVTQYEIVAGSVIPAIMVSAINSTNPGVLTAQVREDVYDSLSGRSLLIPRGSKLLGVYKSEVTKGQQRILVAWKRLIFPDTSAIDLMNMSGADVEGAAGFEGHADTHFTGLLGEALLASIITAGFQLSQPQQQTAAGGSVVVITPGQQAAGAVGQTLTQTVTSQLNANGAIPPTITIPRGYPFVVVVDRDLVLPGPYAGP